MGDWAVGDMLALGCGRVEVLGVSKGACCACWVDGGGVGLRFFWGGSVMDWGGGERVLSSGVDALDDGDWLWLGELNWGDVGGRASWPKSSCSEFGICWSKAGWWWGRFLWGRFLLVQYEATILQILALVTSWVMWRAL